MGHDFVAFANKTLKEYITPTPDISCSCIEFLIGDWFISSAAMYLITDPHRFQMPKGDFSEILSGSWKNSEYMWVSDYDDIYDGNDEWKTDWKDITSEAYIMLMEYNHSAIYELIAELNENPRAILLLGKVYEDTKSDMLERELVKVFGNAWRKWYYYALNNRHLINWSGIDINK
jgi:CRISPR/Cas system CSM-associated protein Csm4 (group 5 of RAMP superfamily)